MIPRGCFLRVVDNSGAKIAQVIGLYGQTGQYASVGNIVKVAIKESKGEKVPPGTMRRAVVVETRYPIHRPNGSYVQYMRNACVLLTEKGAPLGNRVRAMLPHEFAKPRWKRLSSLSKHMF